MSLDIFSAAYQPFDVRAELPTKPDSSPSHNPNRHTYIVLYVYDVCRPTTSQTHLTFSDRQTHDLMTEAGGGAHQARRMFVENLQGM